MFIMRCKHRNCPVGRDTLHPAATLPCLCIINFVMCLTSICSGRWAFAYIISPRHSKYSGGRTMCGPTGGMYSKCWLPIIKCTCRERSIPALPRGKTTHVALFKTSYKIYACPGTSRTPSPTKIREKFGTKFAGAVSHSTGGVRWPCPTRKLQVHHKYFMCPSSHPRKSYIIHGQPRT